MTHRVRLLDPARDREAVSDLYRRSADYVGLERDEPPGPALTDEFFTDALPGADLTAMRKLGMEDVETPGALLAIVDMGFGYPEPGDAYLGLLQVAEAARGQGLGALFLREAERIAQEAGAARLYIAVLHANPRGRAFWEREGFRVALDNRPVTLGKKSHLATRMVKDLC
ncbi:MAG: GNAT family N-acetyltransferase [Paracoccaceae bacterium]